MRFTRRRLFAAVGLVLASAAGCGPSKDDTKPHPDLGPPPTNGPPPRRGAAPEAGKPKS